MKHLILFAVMLATLRCTAYCETGNPTASGVMPQVGHCAVEKSMVNGCRLEHESIPRMVGHWLSQIGSAMAETMLWIFSCRVKMSVGNSADGILCVGWNSPKIAKIGEFAN